MGLPVNDFTAFCQNNNFEYFGQVGYSENTSYSVKMRDIP